MIKKIEMDNFIRKMRGKEKSLNILRIRQMLRAIDCRQLSCNDPPAEPEAFRLLAPQRGLIATDQKPSAS
jgi:hypothetical protein